LKRLSSRKSLLLRSEQGDQGAIPASARRRCGRSRRDSRHRRNACRNRQDAAIRRRTIGGGPWKRSAICRNTDPLPGSPTPARRSAAAVWVSSCTIRGWQKRGMRAVGASDGSLAITTGTSSSRHASSSTLRRRNSSSQFGACFSRQIARLWELGAVEASTWR